MWYVLVFIFLFVCASRYISAKGSVEAFTGKRALTPPSYVPKEFVGVSELPNDREKCPTYYEDINRQILQEHLSISETSYAYTPNRYLDITRFVDYRKLKEPLPVNPDFFMS